MIDDKLPSKLKPYLIKISTKFHNLFSIIFFIIILIILFKFDR